MNNKIFSFINAFRKKFSEEGVFKESAALTFVTLLGFIPFIIFILFFLPKLPFLKLESQFKDMMISIFLPSSVEQISEYISEIASKKIHFNLFNFIILFITSFSLFKIINDSFDRILNVHEKRKNDFLSNTIKFIGMTIFGSLLILILFSASSFPLVSEIFNLPLLQELSLYLTPVIILFIIFTLGFYFIPTIKVKNRSILIGSAAAAIVWIIFKFFFNWYIIHLTNTKLIFGVLATIPIFLFWIYTNWIIILSGVIIVSIMENRHIKPEGDLHNDGEIKVTFEKIIGNDYLDQISTTVLSSDDLKKILSSIIEEQKTKETEEPKKE